MRPSRIIKTESSQPFFAVRPLISISNLLDRGSFLMRAFYRHRWQSAIEYSACKIEDWTLTLTLLWKWKPIFLHEHHITSYDFLTLLTIEHNLNNYECKEYFLTYSNTRNDILYKEIVWNHLSDKSETIQYDPF